MKPENILFDANGKIVICDFGLAKQTKAVLEVVAGTPYFMAPEVIDGHYQEKCDIWSLGVILYMLVTGMLPFQGNSKPEVYGKIRKGQYRQPRSCSDNCRELISQMLTVDPAKRPDAATCARHPWFAEMAGKNHSEVAQDPQVT